MEVDEAGAGDFGLGDQRRGRQLGEDQVRQFARILLQRARQLHRGVAGEVAVGGVFRAFDLEADRGIGCHRFEGGADQEGELVFEQVGAGHVDQADRKTHASSVSNG
jgi:hypothetical protein